jgi:hypothetical protein
MDADSAESAVPSGGLGLEAMLSTTRLTPSYRRLPRSRARLEEQCLAINRRQPTWQAWPENSKALESAFAPRSIKPPPTLSSMP